MDPGAWYGCCKTADSLSGIAETRADELLPDSFGKFTGALAIYRVDSGSTPRRNLRRNTALQYNDKSSALTSLNYCGVLRICFSKTKRCAV